MSAPSRRPEIRRRRARQHKITTLRKRLASAQTDADRRAAQANLDKLRQQKFEMEKRIQEAKNAAAKAERVKGVHLSKECLDNPLAKGCS